MQYCNAARMKPLLFILLLGLIIGTHAQTPLSFSAAVQTDSADTKEKLLDSAKVWFGVYFKDTKAVLKGADTKTGKLTGTGSLKFSSSNFVGSNATKGTIWFDVIIQCHTGGYIYELTNFKHEGTAGTDARYGNYPAVSFGLLTMDSVCPPKLMPKEDKRWRDSLWKELRQNAYLESYILADDLKQAMHRVPKKKR